MIKGAVTLGNFSSNIFRDKSSHVAKQAALRVLHLETLLATCPVFDDHFATSREALTKV